MKAADLLVKALEAEGVEYVFGLPGEENLALLDALRRSSIRLVLTRHEQVAGFMAATYGRLTGKAGVCMSTLGPGATNLVTAAAYAQLGAMPMVMLTGQKPIKSSKQGRFQIIDIVDMMRPLTQFTRQVPSGDTVPALVREVFRRTQEERPGAGHLELPEDVAEEETAAPLIAASSTRRPIAEDKAIDRAVAAIEGARCPLVLVGAAANRKLTSKMLGRFLERTGLWFFDTQMGKGVVDGRHPRYLGCAALSSGDFVHRAIAHADLIVNVGHDVIEKPPFFMEAGGRTVIHVNFASAEVDPVYFPQVEVVGDIANSIWQLSERVERQAGWDFGFFERVKDALDAHVKDRADDEGFPLVPQRVVAAVREAMPSDGIVALDNGMYKIWFARNYAAHRPNTLLLDNALATMGAGLPSAMAARLVHGDRRVLAVCGDGGFLMNTQALETAVRLGLDLVVLVLDDNAYGMIRWKQKKMGLDDWGLEFGNPDFVRLAEAYGAAGHRVSAGVDLAGLIERCHAAGGVHVIDCPVDYADNDRVLNHEIERLSAAL